MVESSVDSDQFSVISRCSRALARTAELARFCRIALGSASELEYHLLLARDLSYLAGPAYTGLNAQGIEIRRVLTALVQKLVACAQ